MSQADKQTTIGAPAPNTTTGMHLTVTRDGLVSLWDLQVLPSDETYVFLKLTPKQHAQIAAAAREAR